MVRTNPIPVRPARIAAHIRHRKIFGIASIVALPSSIFDKST
jgi:hypothetical protein